MTFFCLWCNAPFEEGQAPAPCPKAPEYASKLAVADVRWAGCTPIVCIMCGEPLTELRAPCKVDPLHRTCAQTLVIESREAVEAAGNGPPCHLCGLPILDRVASMFRCEKHPLGWWCFSTADAEQWEREGKTIVEALP